MKATFPDFEDFQVMNGQGPQAYHFGKPPHELVFIAAHHTNDPASPLYVLIDQKFHSFKPQIVLHESYINHPDARMDGVPEEVIKQYGEPMYVCRLARDAGIPYDSIELGFQIEHDAYVAKYGEELVATFYILRQIWQYHRQITKAPTFEGEVRNKFEQGFKNLGVKHFAWDQLESICRRELGQSFDPDDSDKLEYYMKITDPTKTGTIFNEISLYTSYIRDQAVMNKITELKQKYQCIFAVMGASYYYTIESYLRKLYL